MKIFEPENDKFIFSHVTLLGQPFQKQDTERRQPMFRHHLDQRPSAQDSIDGSVKTVLGHSDRLLAKKMAGVAMQRLSDEGTNKSEQAPEPAVERRARHPCFGLRSRRTTKSNFLRDR